MRVLLFAGTSLLALSTCIAGATAAPITFAETGALQTFTAPTTGVYDILAFGAQGGNEAGYSGGGGAEIGGTFSLTAGETLTILVGGQGGSNGATSAAGGGGGSFVVVTAGDVPLVVAGGGGGGYLSNGGGTGTSGNAGSGGLTIGGAGGTGGAGGGATTLLGIVEASGGGGFSGAGGGGAGGASFLGGGAGGANPGPLDFGAAGGFGGGDGGGGGGSFLSTLASDPILVGSENAGNGEVVITEVPAVVVPEPGSLAVLGTALAAVGLIRRRPRASKGA